MKKSTIFLAVIKQNRLSVEIKDFLNYKIYKISPQILLELYLFLFFNDFLVKYCSKNSEVVVLLKLSSARMTWSKRDNRILRTWRKPD